MLFRVQLFSCIAVLAFSPARAQEAKPLPVAALSRDSAVDFETEILPAFKNNCLACHNQTKAKADLILETPQTIINGGDSGPAVVPGKSSESLLFKAASHTGDPIMPPRDNKAAATNLSPNELALLKLWIDQGAKGEVRQVLNVEWQPLPATVNPIYSVALTRDGQFAACARGNQIFIYHLSTSKLLARLDDPLLSRSNSQIRGGAHLDLVQSLAFSPDGLALASGAYREAKIWRRSTNVLTSIPAPRPTNGFVHVILARGDQRLLGIDSNGTATVWQVLSNQWSRLSTFTLSNSQAIAWSGDDRLATGDTNGTLRIWQIPKSSNAGPAVLKEFKAHSGEISALAWNGTNEIVSGGVDAIRVWKLGEGEQVRELKQEKPVVALALSGDGKRLVSANKGAPASIWLLEDGKAVAELKGDRYLNEAAAEAERNVALASNEVGYQKGVLEKMEKDQKTQSERLSKATNSMAKADAAFTEKQKALASATESKDAAGKTIASLEAEIKKVTEDFQAAEKTAKEAVEAAKKKAEEAALARIAADQAAQTKEQTERIAAEAASVAARTKPASTNGTAADKIATEAEAIAQRAKAFAQTAADDAGAKGKAAAEAKASSEKAIEELASKSFAAGQLKPLFDKTTADAPTRVKEATDKLTAASNAFVSAEKEFKKAQQAKSIAAQELELAKAAIQQAEVKVADVKAALQNAENLQGASTNALQTARGKAAEESPVHAVAFSPDGKLVATSHADGRIRTWSQTGRPLETYNAAGADTSSLAFGSDADLLSFSESENLICRWNLNPEWKLDKVIGTGDSASPLSGRVNVLRFSPDGQQLATGSGEPTRSGDIHLWNPADGRLIGALTNAHSDAVLALDFSPDGQRLASGAADRFVRVLELSNGKTLKTFEGHTHHVLGVSWKRDGRTLASSGADNVVKVWDFVSGERKKNIDGFSKEVTSVSFIGVTDQAVVTSGDPQVRLVRENGENVRTLTGAADYMYSAAATPDGKIIVAGGMDSTLRVWDGNDGKEVEVFTAPVANKP